MKFGHVQYLMIISMIFLSCFLLVSSSSSSSSSYTSKSSSSHLCQDDQKSILLQFKNESSSTNVLASWKANTDCCSWEGITCDNATGHVIGLDLSSGGYQLEGTIDSNSSLFKLHTLLSLDLSGNFFLSFDFSDEHGFGFDQLSNLTHLNLSGTQIFGQVPLQISRLTKLVSLDLSIYIGWLKLESPNLERLIHNMSSLRLLHLDRVDMSSKNNSNWCDALSSAVPNLLVLSLKYCSISGPICSSLSNLHFLSEIDLSGNSLSSEFPEFLVNMSSLISIRLEDCELHGEFPINVLRLPRLQEISLSGNPRLHGSLPDFPHHSALRHLATRRSNFHGSIPSSIGNLKHLHILDLSYNNFSGKIPDSIVSLTTLEYLDLSSNNFSGSIPPLILPTNVTSKFEEDPNLSPDSGLLRLTFLDFSENSLEGVINYSLFILPSLVYLDLKRNAFQALPAQVPYKPSPFLSEMYLSDNILQGTFPGWMAQLTRLSILDLSSNEFSGSMDMDAFSNMTILRELYLSDNHYWSLTASPNSTFPQLETFKSHSCSVVEFPTFLRNNSTPILSDLDLSINRIKGKIPGCIWTIPLSSLNLSLNLLTGLEEPFPSSSTLWRLDLHSNQLQGSLPLIPQHARYLDYSNNSFTSFLPEDIGSKMSVAALFSISGNNLVGKIPTSICNASELEVLDLSNNNLIGPIPSCVGNISRFLSVIDLRGNSLQGTMPRVYAASLTTLVLNGNQLEGKVPSALFGCQQLEVLDLGNNQLNDMFPFRLENLLQLRVLVLHSNRFYGQIKHPPTKNAFPTLQAIDLSFNAFTGQLPSEYFQTWEAMMKGKGHKSRAKYLGYQYGIYYRFWSSMDVNMKGGKFHLERIVNVFTSIDLSNNQFEGKIPESIGELKSLHVLDLSSNNLDGPIPSSMENIQQLESLALSDNKLSGKIPVGLASLTFLSFLDLAGNKLEGPIPSGGQFNTFPPKSYERNPLLCGFPLSKKCGAAGDEELARPIREHSTSSEFEWKAAWMGYGCGMVAGLSIGYILFWGNGVFAQSIPMKRRRPRGRRTS